MVNTYLAISIGVVLILDVTVIMPSLVNSFQSSVRCVGLSISIPCVHISGFMKHRWLKFFLILLSYLYIIFIFITIQIWRYIGFLDGQMMYRWLRRRKWHIVIITTLVTFFILRAYNTSGDERPEARAHRVVQARNVGRYVGLYTWTTNMLILQFHVSCENVLSTAFKSSDILFLYIVIPNRFISLLGS